MCMSVYTEQIHAAMKTPVPCLQLYLLLLTWGWTSGSGDITCTATTSHTQSTVTCFFHGDLSQLKNNFNVQFYYPPKTDSPDQQLACNWLLTGSIKCSKGQGVHFNNNVTDRLTFTAPPMVDRVGGEYMCHVLTGDDVTEHPCTLVFTGDAEITDSHADKHYVVTTLHPLNVLTFVLLLIVVALLVCGGCLLYKYRQRVSKYIRRLGAEENGDVGSPLIDKPDATILIVGPQGSGKSSLANTITGGGNFPVDHSTAGNATTKKPTEAMVTLRGKKIKVVDTPCIFGPGHTEDYRQQQVSQWKKMTAPDPNAILLTLNGTDDFKAEHTTGYLSLQTVWRKDFCRRLMVVFTFGDRRPALRPGTSLEDQLKTTGPPLRRILEYAENRYVEVSNKASQEENAAAVRTILDFAENRATEDMSPDQSHAAARPDPQVDDSQNEPLLTHDTPDTSPQRQTPTQAAGAARQ